MLLKNASHCKKNNSFSFLYLDVKQFQIVIKLQGNISLHFMSEKHLILKCYKTNRFIQKVTVL